MNPFAFACFTPHGSEVIADLSQPDVGLMARTRESMERLGRDMSAAQPEVIVVLTPHGLRVAGQFVVADSEVMVGEVEDHGGVVRMARRVDRSLAKTIAEAAKNQGLPIALANFGTSAGPLSILPLDWGTIVPLYFMPETPVVVVSPSRELDFAQHLAMGSALAEAVVATHKRVGLIASCDWAHTHTVKGPYGYHRAAKELDMQVLSLVQANNLEAMAEFPLDWVEQAKPDGIWQALILAGAIPHRDRKIELVSYELPTYFGLLCAGVRGA